MKTQKRALVRSVFTFSPRIALLHGASSQRALSHRKKKLTRAASAAKKKRAPLSGISMQIGLRRASLPMEDRLKTFMCSRFGLRN